LKIELCALHWGWGNWVGPQTISSSAEHPRKKAQISKRGFSKERFFFFFSKFIKMTSNTFLAEKDENSQ